MIHPLARLDGLAIFCAILAEAGAACPDCGHGTRATSRRWAKCPECGRTRIPRCSIEEAGDRIKARVEGMK